MPGPTPRFPRVLESRLGMPSEGLGPFGFPSRMALPTTSDADSHVEAKRPDAPLTGPRLMVHALCEL
jgi:hypothetical protein